MTIISLNTGLDLKILSPSGPVGILIDFIGLIFTAMIFYIIYAVSTDKESLEDKKIRTKKESLQQEKIGKLFPKKKWIWLFYYYLEIYLYCLLSNQSDQKTLILILLNQTYLTKI